jgi:hypothetical protein
MDDLHRLRAASHFDVQADQFDGNVVLTPFEGPQSVDGDLPRNNQVERLPEWIRQRREYAAFFLPGFIDRRAGSRASAPANILLDALVAEGLQLVQVIPGVSAGVGAEAMCPDAALDLPLGLRLSCWLTTCCSPAQGNAAFLRSNLHLNGRTNQGRPALRRCETACYTVSRTPAYDS